ncbi:hypothetical protein [Candidatus Entotheonella palauensis]|uniref:VWFA domain-containing protein n=1 Tax=Candidatus Entotheonella gemina TaxID=1429439 RepID=W4MBT7_9BACT|nr:hypothetical protein [Candidatus Entotheonella palauensis]ETX07789.1 MAG: hypothetical protein ETSY2_09150 [Candidatus Entotheonella gemina]
MSNSTPNLNHLFQTAHAEGELSAQGLQTLTIQADMGSQIQAGLGIDPDDVPSAEVVLVTMMPDDSGSIRFAGNTQVVREGHNLVLDALGQCQQQDELLVHTRYLNGRVLFPYCQLGDTTRMSKQNYNPDRGTPLYDQAAVVLGTVMAKAWEFQDHGVPVRTVTLLITDGADEHSRHQSAATVRALVDDMRRSESHIVAAMGIDNGSTNFRQVLQEMGIVDEWILTPGNSAREIRAAFQVFSQSAVRVSQGSAAFSSALGGFATR